MRYEIREILADVDKIMPFMNRVDTLHIQGGEPFLYSDLDKLLIHLNEHYRSSIGNIHIATNGTIMPSRDVLETIKKYDNISVRISDYKNRKLDEKLAEEGIPYYVYKFVHGESLWNYTGGIDYVEPEHEDFKSKFLHCMWNRCYTVENHLLGRCARSIPAITLQKVRWSDGDYIDLKKKNISFDDVSKYFLFFHPMTCCHNCAGSNGRFIQAAIQIDERDK